MLRIKVIMTAMGHPSTWIGDAGTEPPPPENLDEIQIVTLTK